MAALTCPTLSAHRRANDCVCWRPCNNPPHLACPPSASSPPDERKPCVRPQRLPRRRRHLVHHSAGHPWSASAPLSAFRRHGLHGHCLASPFALIALCRIDLPLHRRACQRLCRRRTGTFGAMLAHLPGRPVHRFLAGFGPLRTHPLVTSLSAALWLKEDSLRPARLAGLALALWRIGAHIRHQPGSRRPQAVSRHCSPLLGVVIMRPAWSA